MGDGLGHRIKGGAAVGFPGTSMQDGGLESQVLDFASSLPPRQRHPGKRSANPSAVIIHVPLPRVRRATVDKGGMESVFLSSASLWLRLAVRLRRARGP